MDQAIIERVFLCDGAQGPETLRYSALRAFHMDGNFAMLALAFVSLEGALQRLARRGAAHRHQVTVRCAHPGSGVRDAIEYLTRAQTREAFTLQRDLVAPRLNPHADFAYAWAVGGVGLGVLCQVRPGALPLRFFELFALARAGGLDVPAQTELAQLKHEIEARVLRSEPEAVIDFQEQAA